MPGVTSKEVLDCARKLRRLAATFTNETDPRYELRAALGEAAGYLVVLEAERGQMSRIIDDLEKRK